MGKLQDWSNENSMEQKVLAQLAKRADLEAGHFESGLRSRSSNFGLGSRSESMSSLQGCSERHRRGGRPAGCCLAAIAGFIFLVALTLLLKQRAQLSASAAEAAAMEAPVPAAAVTTASLAAGLSKAATRCSALCLAEAQQLLQKQPDITDGARGAAYDSCFAHCAASSPADVPEKLAAAQGGAVSGAAEAGSTSLERHAR